MSTNFTSKIADGITFNEFILSCSRYEKGTVEEEVASDCHLKEVKKAKAKLKKILAMDAVECARAATKKHIKEVNHNKRMIQVRIDLKQKYEKMLKEVEAWDPPSIDHSAFKRIMIDQILDSISCDCDTSYYQKQKIPLLSGRKWKAEMIDHLNEDIRYYSDKYAKEVDNTYKRKLWIRQLKNSLT